MLFFQTWTGRSSKHYIGVHMQVVKYHGFNPGMEPKADTFILGNKTKDKLRASQQPKPSVNQSVSQSVNKFLKITKGKCMGSWSS